MIDFLIDICKTLCLGLVLVLIYWAIGTYIFDLEFSKADGFMLGIIAQTFAWVVFNKEDAKA